MKKIKNKLNFAKEKLTTISCRIDLEELKFVLIHSPKVLRGLLKIGEGLTKSMFVEKEALLHLEQLHSMKQKATSLTA